MGIHANFRTLLWNREAIEDEIERLIAILDCEGGDCDLEEDHDAEAVNEDGFDMLMPTLPQYGIDQSAGPINEAVAYRAYRASELGLRPTETGGWQRG